MFYRLSVADTLHHGVFVPFLALPGYMYEWGALGNFQLFFICGVPGGVIYYTLVLHRCGALLRVREPELSYALNVYMRLPGILAAQMCMVLCLASGTVQAPTWAAVAQLVLGTANAVKYASESRTRAERRRL